MQQYFINKYRPLLFAAALLFSSLGIMAQPPQNITNIHTGGAYKMEPVSVFERNTNQNDHQFNLSKIRKKPNRIKAGVNTTHPNSNQAHNNSKVSVSNTSALPDLLIGTFYCKGVSYFGGFITGEVIITADETDDTKIWIENFIPGSSNHNIYGIVSGNQNTVSIPQNQVIYTEDDLEVKLSVYNSSSNISGNFDPSTGVLTITTDLWGAIAPDGWYEIFTGNVSYTRLDMLPPSASYRQPDGGLFLGLIPDSWGSYSVTCIIGSPYTTWNWKVNELEDDVAYSWSYFDGTTEKAHSSKSDSLIMKTEDHYYDTPILTATNKKGYSSTFTLGAYYRNYSYQSYTIAGGNAALLGVDEECDYSCASLDNGFTLLEADDGSYYFGTGASKFADADYESLVVYYEKPLTPLYFEGVNVYLQVFEAPGNTQFKMNVIKAEKDEDGFFKRGDLVATATLLADFVTEIRSGGQTEGYTMEFTGFEIQDEDGFWMPLEYFIMEDAFFLELTGFNTEGVLLAVASEEINPMDGKSRSLFTYKNDESFYSWDDNRQTMFFNLSNAIYSYVSFSEKMIYDNRSGGIYIFEAYPYFDSLAIVEQDIPDWMNVEILYEAYTDNYWGASVQLTIDALPENEAPRYYDLLFSTTGATNSILINQGGTVSAKNLNLKESIFAQKNHLGYIIHYPYEMKSMAIYSMSGQLISNYNLPQDGHFQLYDSTIPKGIYILKLQGSNRVESIKVSF